MTWQIYTKEIKMPYKKRIIIHIFPIKIKLYYNKMTRHQKQEVFQTFMVC